MPKATKKKKEKQADFTKAKLKLGKGKKTASNATDTSFKARSIALPGQEALNRALLVKQGGATEPSTANGLTLSDLAIRLRHPNAAVRKESLGGIREILVINPSREINKVLRALGGLITDDDAGVRKSLLGLIEWYIARLPVSVLSPHLPLLVLQTSSALSHIFPEIRLDACKLVHVLLQHVPSHVVNSWPDENSNTLEGLRLAIGLSGGKGADSQIGRLTGAAKLVTMRTIREFVQIGLKTQEREIFGKGYIVSEDDKGYSRSKTIGETPILEDVQLEGWLIGQRPMCDLSEGGNVWEMGQIGPYASQGTNAGIIYVLSQLYLQLHPLLLSTFLENAPTAFSPSAIVIPSSTSEDVPLALCETAAGLTRALVDAILVRVPRGVTTPELKKVRKCMADFHKRMTGWFPFRCRATKSSGIPPSFALSLVYADLAILLSPSITALKLKKSGMSQQRDGRVGESSWRERIKAVEEAWKNTTLEDKNLKTGGRSNEQGWWAVEEVADWVFQVLTPKKDMLTPNLTSEAYSCLLPIVWALLVQPPSSSSSDKIDVPTHTGVSFLNHLLCQGFQSSIRRLGDEFMISLIHAHEQKYPVLPLYFPPHSAIRPLIKRWFSCVPKALVEHDVKKDGEQNDERLLRFLLKVGLKGERAYEQPYSLLNIADFSSIANLLASFFYLSQTSTGPMPGPWTKLSRESTKKLGLDVAKVWKEWDRDGTMRNAVERACDRTKWHDYWVKSS
ncbi:uncharacterized protein L203_103945 [Cryptococcus depauperatus CBS 7841]|uniref:Pre-rRNA-processing protein n=1 Tax=Cryptococcus depauperatus CBS 7841 TaxID=1295531 RepID=A0A1E3HSD2_9TREE|nr:pre-rRNA-processing protein IPI1 [Cryptococcus depauperatus CBS 7841]